MKSTLPAALSLLLVAFVSTACSPGEDLLSGEARVVRDTMGVPHVFAGTATDLFFGAGYAMAEDRLFETYYRCRLGKGRLAELVGEGGVPTDREMRTRLYTEEEWQTMVDALSEEHRALLLATLEGINRYIEEALAEPKTKMPYEFQALGVELEPLTVTDLAAGMAYITAYYGGGGGMELQNLEMWSELVERHGEKKARVLFDDVLVLHDPDAYTNVPDDGSSLTALPGSATEETNDVASLPYRRSEREISPWQEQRRGASRAIAIAPSRSASGRVLMMQATADGGDVHLKGAGFDVAGLQIPPMPAPVMGRTPTYGWLVTTGENDMVDIYEEKLNPENERQYWFEGEWRDMEVRTETIEVNGAEPILLEVFRTVHGPVIEWDKENQRAFSRRSNLWKKELLGFPSSVERARASDRDAFERAIELGTAGSYNVVYGDGSGHIEYWHTGSVPLRKDGADPRLPLPGTGEFEWLGHRDPEDWPNVANPEQGYLHAWNSKPDRNTRYGDMSRWGKHYRTYLPKALIEADDSITYAEMEEMNKALGAGFASHDLSITTPDFFQPFFDAAVEGAKDPAVIEAVELLREWDGSYLDDDRDGLYDHAGVGLFRRWTRVASDMIFGDELGDWWWKFDEEIYVRYRTSVLLRALEGEAAGQPMVWDFLNGEDRDTLVRRSLERTVAELREELGKTEVADLRRETIKRRFGGYDLAMRFAVELGHVPAEVHHNGMPAWTAILELGDDPPALQSLTPTGGQSRFIDLDGQANPHINDQTERHVNYDLKTVSLDEETILAEATSTKTLTRE
ncbi:MAG: penicillin acylase family protein [Acidobacteriota bacterium]